MRGVSLSFFKPSVFVKAFLVSCVVFSSAFFSSCKDLTSFDPNVDGGRAVTGSAFSAPVGLTATNGDRRKISLEWSPVSNAQYYEIFCSESNTGDFRKRDEVTKTQLNDTVTAGKTIYYKVRAVKSNGMSSGFSSTVKGASLAKPVIIGGNVQDYGVTIQWFMENSRSLNGDDNYEKSLKFDVCYKTLSDSDWKEKTVDASSVIGGFFNSYEYTLTNLANAEDYQFKIKAYTVDKSSFEESNAVTKTTMVSYVPLAPEFEASEGTSAKEISLKITIPPMAMVHTVTNNSNGEEVDVEFPLYFTIYRKSETEIDYKQIVEKLYCNGTTSAPDYSKLKETYIPDSVIVWVDDEDLVSGEKYEYMLCSHIDIDYAKIVCPGSIDLDAIPGPFSESRVGWISAPILFEIDRSRFKDNGLMYSSDMTKICSVSFGFNAEWDDLGKADDYKFAIKQNRRPLASEDSDSGVNEWLTKNENYFFETLGEVNSYEVVFGSASGLKENEKGVYSYTLYIVPKDAELVEGEWNSVLDFERADEVRVTDEVELPKAEFEVKGGYNDRVRLTISNFEPDVQYAITRTRWEGGQPTKEAYSFVLDENDSEQSDGEVRSWYDMGVEDNCRYSYDFVATASSGVHKEIKSQFADTLGTPDVLFEISKLDYDSFTISFENVLAAEEYEITIGDDGGFAGGFKYRFAIDEVLNRDAQSLIVNDDTADEVAISFEESENKFIVVVKEPYGYDKADLAGMFVDASVKAFSDVDNALGSAKVGVLGPALVNAAVTGNTDKLITMTWDEVDGASGYLIYRTTYKDAAATEIESTDTFFYPVTDDGASDSPSLTKGEKISDESILITKSDGKYVLRDEDTPADADASGFRKNQSRVSWGRPYGYIVLPVKGKNDFSFEPDSKTLADGARVDYTKNGALAEAQGSTYGYGMSTAASKSVSTTNVAVEWKKPNAREGLVPTLYRRAVGTDGAFAKVKAVESLSDTDELSGEALYEAFEYVVKYGETEGSDDDDISVPASLLAELAADKETRYTYSNGRTEPKNRGYAFAAKLSAAKDDDNKYYEAINCEWDYSKRGIGPEKSTLYVYNNNIKDEWVDVLSANGESDFSVIGADIDILDTDTERRGVFSIAPQGIAAGTANTTDGMLKVLRDYKHYYKLKIERSDIAYEVGNDKDVFAYRDITDEELVKATMLIIAAIEHDSDSQSHNSGGNFGLGGATGSFSGSGSLTSSLTWTITNYTHQWKRMPNGDTSVPAFMTLNDSGGNRGRKYGMYFVTLHNGGNSETADLNKKIPISITTEVYGDITVEFAADKEHFAANVIRDGTTVSFTASGLENCRYWLPIEWHKEGTAAGWVNTQKGYGYFGEDPNYGWWPAN